MTTSTLAPESSNLAKIQDLPKGEYIKRKPGARTVYIKGDYDSVAKAWECSDCEDTNRVIYIKKGKLVHVGFEY